MKSTTRSRTADIMRHVVMTLLIITITYNSGYALSTVYGVEVMLLLLVPTWYILILRQIISKGVLVTEHASLTILLTMFLGVTLTVLVNYSTSTVMSAARFLLVASTAFLVSNTITFETFVNGYIRILKFLTLISLAVYVVVNFVGYDLNLPVFVNTNGVQYRSGFVFFLIDDAARTSVRNIGIFWEAGLFSSFLLIALVFELLFTEAKVRKSNILIFVLGILSTQSTAGITMLGLIACIALAKMMGRNRTGLVVAMLAFAGGLYFFWGDIVAYLISSFPGIFSKFDLRRATAYTRLMSPKINLRIWLESPWFGHGFTNASTRYSEFVQEYGYLVHAQTSTSTFLMSSLGLTGVLYTAIWIRSILNLPNIDPVPKFAVLLLFLSILNKEPHAHNLLMWCIFFYFVKQTSESPGKSKQHAGES